MISSFLTKDMLGIYISQNNTLSFVNDRVRYDHKVERAGIHDGYKCRFYVCVKGCNFQIVERLLDGCCTFQGLHSCATNINPIQAPPQILFNPFILHSNPILSTLPNPMEIQNTVEEDNNNLEIPITPIFDHQPQQQKPRKRKKKKKKSSSNQLLNNRRKKYIDMVFIDKSEYLIKEARGRKGAKNLVQYDTAKKYELHRFLYHDKTKEYVRYCCRNRKKKKCNVVIYERVTDGRISIRGNHNCVNNNINNNSNNNNNFNQKFGYNLNNSSSENKKILSNTYSMMYHQFSVQPQICGILPNRIIQSGSILRFFLIYPNNWPIPNINQIQINFFPMNDNKNNDVINREIQQLSLSNMNLYNNNNKQKQHPITFVGRQSGEECGFLNSNLQIHLVLPFFLNEFPNGNTNVEIKFLLGKNDAPISRLVNGVIFDLPDGNNNDNNEHNKPNKKRKRNSNNSMDSKGIGPSIPPHPSPPLTFPSSTTSSNNNNNNNSNENIIYGLFPNKGSLEGGEFIEIYCSIPFFTNNNNNNNSNNFNVFFGSNSSFICSVHPCDDDFPISSFNHEYPKSEETKDESRRYFSCRNCAKQIIVVKTPSSETPGFVDLQIFSSKKNHNKILSSNNSNNITVLKNGYEYVSSYDDDNINNDLEEEEEEVEILLNNSENENNEITIKDFELPPLDLSSSSLGD